MSTMTKTPDSTDETTHTANRRVSSDARVGLGLLGVAIVGKLVWTLSDGGILAVVGAR
jgi:hypothetical protein